MILKKTRVFCFFYQANSMMTTQPTPHTQRTQRQNAGFLSWSDFVMDSRLTFFDEVLRSHFPEALIHNHVRFHDTEYIAEEFMSMYKYSQNKPSRYLQQCYTLHPAVKSAVSSILHHYSPSLYKSIKTTDSTYFDLDAFETDQKVLQRRYSMNHHTIDFITFLQTSRWHDAFLKQLELWEASIAGQQKLLCRHTRRRSSSTNGDETEFPYASTLQQLLRELDRHRPVFQAFQEKGAIMQLLRVIRRQLRAQNKVIQFFLNSDDHLHCLRTHTRTLSNLQPTRDSYLHLTKLYTTRLDKGKTREAMCDAMRMQRQHMHVKETKVVAPTPFRQHLLKNTNITMYTDTAPTALWFLDNAFSHAKQQASTLQYECPSYAGSLVSYVQNAFHTPVYKRLRTVYVESESIASQCYFDVFYTNTPTHQTTQHHRLVTAPTIVQPAGKHQKIVRSRARKVAFEEVGVLDEFYRLYVPVDGGGDGVGVRKYLDQPKSYCLHPVNLYRGYYV
jgi:hypothetical protein